MAKLIISELSGYELDLAVAKIGNRFNNRQSMALRIAKDLGPMTPVRITELDGIQLKWAFARCKGWLILPNTHRFNDELVMMKDGEKNIWFDEYAPTLDELIQEEGITVGPHVTSPFVAHYGPYSVNKPWADRYIGATPFIAAARCFIAKKSADDWVEIPDKLTEIEQQRPRG